MTVGGDALNEATILAKHGKSVYLETVLGNDDVGNYLCSHYARHGIELSEAVVKASYMTGINVVLVQKNGERNFLTNRNSECGRGNADYRKRNSRTGSRVLMGNTMGAGIRKR
jgi:sugar/nucleoside kinase (ribokinase family)